MLDFRHLVHEMQFPFRVPDGKPAWVLKLETLAKRLLLSRGSVCAAIAATREKRPAAACRFPGIALKVVTFITK